MTSLAAIQREDLRLRAMVTIDHTKPIDMTQHIVRRIGASKPRKGERVTMQDVLTAVCAETGRMSAELTGQRRHRTVARVRQIAYHLMKTHCSMRSLPEIGRFMGGRDHTTILHGCRKVEALLTEDPDFTAVYRRCERGLLK